MRTFAANQPMQQPTCTPPHPPTCSVFIFLLLTSPCSDPRARPPTPAPAACTSCCCSGCPAHAVCRAGTRCSRPRPRGCRGHRSALGPRLRGWSAHGVTGTGACGGRGWWMGGNPSHQAGTRGDQHRCWLRGEVTRFCESQPSLGRSAALQLHHSPDSTKKSSWPTWCVCRGVQWPGVNTSTPKDSDRPNSPGSNTRACVFRGCRVVGAALPCLFASKRLLEQQGDGGSVETPDVCLHQ